MTDSSIVVPVQKMPRLARPAGGNQSVNRRNDQTLGFLCFCLGDEEFGVDLNLVKQIVQPPPITFVPRTKSFFLGVISVRGGVVTMIDLRQLLGLEPSEIGKLSRVLLFNAENEQVGLLVDCVTQVRRVSIAAFEVNPVLEENPVTDKVVGIIRPEPGVQVTVIELGDIVNEALR